MIASVFCFCQVCLTSLQACAFSKAVRCLSSAFFCYSALAGSLVIQSRVMALASGITSLRGILLEELKVPLEMGLMGPQTWKHWEQLSEVVALHAQKTSC